MRFLWLLGGIGACFVGFIVTLVGAVSLASGIYIGGLSGFVINGVFGLALIVAGGWWLIFAGRIVLRNVRHEA